MAISLELVAEAHGRFLTNEHSVGFFLWLTLDRFLLSVHSSKKKEGMTCQKHHHHRNG